VRTEEVISVLYDGLDAADHSIEIDAFADSLKGLGRIIGVTATFATTDKLVMHADARPLKIVVGPPKPNCVTLSAAIAWVDQSALVAGTASTLIASLIIYIVRSATQKAEMKHLRDIAELALRQAGHRDDAVIGRLLDTIDKMADTLRPSVRKAVKPVGVTAHTMTVSNPSGFGEALVIDKPMRDAIDAEEPIEVGDEISLMVRFSEMNWDARTCKVATEIEPEVRYSAEITDPAVQVPNNAYAAAFAGQTPLQVRAKPTLRNGSVERWYISAHF
jgi:hypothetical protein